MDLNLSIFLLLFWTLLLFVLSCRMVQANAESQPKYSEVIGNLILTALLTIATAVVSEMGSQ